MANKNISLRDFLKIYTGISNKFIDEYMNFYDICANNTFGINLDNVIKYLGIKMRKEFYKKFRNKYELKKDYMILRMKGKKVKNKKWHNTTYHLIHLKKYVCQLKRKRK